MVNGDNSVENTSKMLEVLNNCRRVQFRLNENIKKGLHLIVTRSGYRVNGYSIHDVMRACLLFGVDRFLGMYPDEMYAELLEFLKKTKPRLGRPAGTPKFL